MPRWTPLVVLALGALGPGCKKDRELRDDESLKVVVAEDRKLAQREEDLLARRGTLQRERATIRDRRSELITKKLSLEDTDAPGKAALEQEESKLVNLEARLADQEVALNRRLQTLLDEKTNLADKVGQDQSKHWLLARREHSIALREKETARRETDIARREKLIAEREQAFAVRQAKVCPGRVTTVVQSVPSPRPATGEKYTRKEVEAIYNGAMKGMRAKGILAVDLPAGADRLMGEVRHAVAKGDFGRGKYAADQLLAAVRAVQIDRSFIGAKIGRLAAAIRQRPPPRGQRPKVDALFQQATGSYGDGHFAEANRKLNRIYGLLQ
ncbi:MAG: hypothetical protein IT371_04830 [Deltaproteobacteria bacterium]|nr:hypothetical protein [Deltaproteobacteria bacterium]